MSELSLEQLIKLELPNYKEHKFRISRHVMSGRGWEGFDELIRFDDELLTVFAGNMNTDRYKDADIVLTCVALPKSKALFPDFQNLQVPGLPQVPCGRTDSPPTRPPLRLRIYQELLWQRSARSDQSCNR